MTLHTIPGTDYTYDPRFAPPIVRRRLLAEAAKARKAQAAIEASAKAVENEARNKEVRARRKERLMRRLEERHAQPRGTSATTNARARARLAAAVREGREKAAAIPGPRRWR